MEYLKKSIESLKVIENKKNFAIACNWTSGGGVGPIANVNCLSGTIENRKEAKRIADLMAAGPELYEALLLAKYLIENPSPLNYDKGIEKIVAAIKKANQF
jgi:hypothetical protein|tara:strand:+ start:3520 stop:3822 length:303 start_codon:yes stop_codon:yes gene_type:complete